MKRTWQAILVAGLVAGVLDITYASVSSLVRGSTPARMLRGIASGLLGRAASDGGVPAALLGLACHFTIAMGAATVFVLASRRLRVLAERPILCGALYGLAVFYFMHLIVLPLSRIPWTVSLTPNYLASGFAAHIFCVGLPIAFVARRFAFAPSAFTAARRNQAD